MPGQHCPACGAVPTAAGCACSPHPDLEETAVLPHIEGPPLVRPYIPAATSMPAQEPFATTLLPPAPPYEPEPERYEPRPYEPRTYDPRPYEPRPYEQPTRLIPEPRQAPAPVRELGVFEVQHSVGGRAERRAQQQQDSPGRRRAVILAAGAGIAALGAGLAFAFSPSSDGGHSTDQAIPMPVGSYQPAATTEPPSAAPSPSTSASASPSRTTATRKPSTSRAPVAAITPSLAPSQPPSPAPSTTTANPSTPAPSPSATTVRTLKMGMSGKDVAELQQRLVDALPDQDQSLVTGDFGPDTRDAVAEFQSDAGVRGDKWGVYGPNTRAALESYTN